jgi:ATP/maltotriose-dependent transcriptional regulator MalT
MMTEIGWLQLGDLEGARRRMLALEEELSRTQEVMLRTSCAIYLAWILCETREEQAWGQAEALMLRALSDTSGMLGISLIAQGMLAQVALVQGQLEKAEALSRAATEVLHVAPMAWIGIALVQIRALVGLGRAAEACVVADQMTGTIQMFGCAGCAEVAARLAAFEAFEANGDHDRARVELAETLRQVQLRADDITDPFWKDSYLTRNPYVARALALGREWEVTAGTPA